MKMASLLPRFFLKIMLEGAKATTEAVDALRTGASSMKAMHKSAYVIIDKYFAFEFFSNFISKYF
jgi:hypothetical protein